MLLYVQWWRGNMTRMDAIYGDEYDKGVYKMDLI